ncbi:MAG TPA: peroxide stress protein YaaA [Flavobacteriaceae bacterium]|nr:peroxide stress protein YaaA [Flavobacteriaceae bacterium]
MKIVISPAKSLDFETKVPTEEYTKCAFLKQASKLNTVLKQKSPADLSKLMKISDKLADLNWKRNQEWNLPFNISNSRQAIYAFKGTVYEGLDAYSIPNEKINQLQDKIRILSGQYGILKPLDLMQAYRLEMGTKLVVGEAKNLYQFWDNSITEILNKELQNDEVFINLASNEYFKVVNQKLLKVPIITPIFKDYKNGNLKIIAFFAKKARGMMVRYIIDNNIEKTEDLKGFNYGNYAFDNNLSTETELVFTR